MEATNAGQVATESERIVGEVVNTRYQHTTEIDPETGTYNCDCAGFVSYVLQQVAPEHLNAIPAETGWDHPRAFKYYEYFASLAAKSPNGWHPIHYLPNTVPGDIIAWEETTSDPPPPGEDTGHVLIVAEPPETVETGVMSVAVYDSSDVLHYDDSRDGETGVGTGTLRFKVDNTGRPTAVRFSDKEKNFRDHPIAIGRLEKLPSK